MDTLLNNGSRRYFAEYLSWLTVSISLGSTMHSFHLCHNARRKPLRNGSGLKPQIISCDTRRFVELFLDLIRHYPLAPSLFFPKAHIDV